MLIQRRESTQREAADYRQALTEEAIVRGHIAAELGEVLLAQALGPSGRAQG